ncbi:hypothetical protein D3C84_690050 [compost metagenome]
MCQGSRRTIKRLSIVARVNAGFTRLGNHSPIDRRLSTIARGTVALESVSHGMYLLASTTQEALMAANRRHLRHHATHSLIQGTEADGMPAAVTRAPYTNALRINFGLGTRPGDDFAHVLNLLMRVNVATQVAAASTEVALIVDHHRQPRGREGLGEPVQVLFLDRSKARAHYHQCAGLWGIRSVKPARQSDAIDRNRKVLAGITVVHTALHTRVDSEVQDSYGRSRLLPATRQLRVRIGQSAIVAWRTPEQSAKRLGECPRRVVTQISGDTHDGLALAQPGNRRVHPYLLTPEQEVTPQLGVKQAR